MKKSITLVEIIFILVVVSILYSISIPKKQDSKLFDATNYIVTYLNYTRYLALIDNKFDLDDSLWHKKWWRLRFENCIKSKGGVYFIVTSDDNTTGQAKKSHSAKDPLTNRYLYSRYYCDAKEDESKYVLLTQEFDIAKVELTCNATDSIGQIIYNDKGEVFSKVANTIDETYTKYEIRQKCYIYLYDKNNNKSTIIIEPKTGYAYVNSQ